MLLKIRRIVAYIQSLQTNALVGGIIQLNPRAIVERWVDKHIDIGCHKLVDDKRLGCSIITSNCDLAPSCYPAAILGSDNDCCRTLACSYYITLLVYLDHSSICAAPLHSLHKCVIWFDGSREACRLSHSESERCLRQIYLAYLNILSVVFQTEVVHHTPVRALCLLALYTQFYLTS